MKLQRGKRDPMSYDPNQPHPYQQVNDAGLGALSAGAWSRETGGSAMASVAVTNRYQRAAGCAVPGCGRPRDDELHAPED